MMSTVFLSHSSDDKIFVENLATDLNELGIGVWFDKWEIKVGDSIVEKINHGLENNDFLAVVLTPNSVRSDWVKKELNSAISNQLSKKSIKVLPILFKECKIPAIISDLKYADFTSDYKTGVLELIHSIAPEKEVSVAKKISSKASDDKERIDGVIKSISSKSKIGQQIIEYMLTRFNIDLLDQIDFDKNTFVTHFEKDSNNWNKAIELLESITVSSKMDLYGHIISKYDNVTISLIENTLHDFKCHIQKILIMESWEAKKYINKNVLGIVEENDFVLYDLKKDQKEKYQQRKRDPFRIYNQWDMGFWNASRYLAFWAGDNIKNKLLDLFIRQYISHDRYSDVMHYLLWYFRIEKEDLSLENPSVKRSLSNIPNILKWFIKDEINTQDQFKKIIEGKADPENPGIHYYNWF